MVTAYITFEPGLGKPVPSTTMPEYNEGGTNANLPYLAFDAADNANETCMFGPFRLSNYASTPVAVVQYSMASDVTNNVIWGVSVLAYTSGDSGALTGEAFDTENTVTDTVPATTAGKLKDSSNITLTNFDSGANGDYVVFKVRRNTTAANGDTAAGDARLRLFVFSYTTT